MKRAWANAFHIGSLTLVLASAFSASAIIKGRSADPRVGRSSVYIYDAKNETSCTGVVVHPRLILTAAHCLVKTNKESLSFSNASSPGDRTSRLPIASFHVAAGYEGAQHGMQSMEQSAGDLGAILMKEPILSRLGLKTSDLPPIAMTPDDLGSSLRIVGYGYTSRNASFSDASRRELLVDSELTGGNLRLTSLEKDRTACFGDSGSGVMADDGVQARLFGIVCSIKPGGKLKEEFAKKSAEARAENEIKRQKIIARNLKKGITTPVPEIPIKLPESLLSKVCGDRDTTTQAVPVARHLCWIKKVTSISLVNDLNCSVQE